MDPSAVLRAQNLAIRAGVHELRTASFLTLDHIFVVVGDHLCGIRIIVKGVRIGSRIPWIIVGANLGECEPPSLCRVVWQLRLIRVKIL